MMFLKIPALQFKDLQRGQGRLPEPEVFKLDFSFQWEHPLFPPQHVHAVQTAALHAGVLIGKSSAPSCQIVKWSMNNKSPPELCPCSAVAGDAEHSNLGMQHFFTGKEKKNRRGLSPSLPRKQQSDTCLVWGCCCGSFLQQIWVSPFQNKSVWGHSQLLSMRKRQLQGRGTSEEIAGEGPQSVCDPNNPGLDVLGQDTSALLQFAHFCWSYTDFSSSALLNRA